MGDACSHAFHRWHVPPGSERLPIRQGREDKTWVPCVLPPARALDPPAGDQRRPDGTMPIVRTQVVYLPRISDRLLCWLHALGGRPHQRGHRPMTRGQPCSFIVIRPWVLNLGTPTYALGAGETVGASPLWSGATDQGEGDE